MILHLSINNIFKVETVHRIFFFLLHQFLPQDAPNSMSIPTEIMTPKDKNEAFSPTLSYPTTHEKKYLKPSFK